MNKKQLGKLLGSINNKMSEISLTDEDFIAILDGNDYLIPINVEIDGNANDYLYSIEITDSEDNIILKKSIRSYLFNSDIYISQEVMDNGIKICVHHTYGGALDYIYMNGSLITKNIDYEYEKTDKGSPTYETITDITLLEVTGDIEIFMDAPPPT